MGVPGNFKYKLLTRRYGAT